MFCYKCGSELTEGQIFCHVCGEKTVPYNNAMNNIHNVQQYKYEDDMSDELRENDQHEKVNENIADFSDEKSTSQNKHNIDDFNNLDSIENKSTNKDNIIDNNSNVNQKSGIFESNNFNKYIKRDLSAKKIIILSAVIIAFIIVSLIAVFLIQNFNAKKDIDYVVEQFNKDEIDYNKAIISLDKINCHERDYLIQYRNSAISHLDKLNNSKIAYASAQEYMESGKYDEAIPLFDSVSEDDLNYQDAQMYLSESQQKYLDSVNSLVEKYIANNDYELALNLCEQAKQIIPDSTDDIDIIITEIEETQELFYEEQVKALEESAKANYENGDYSAAINDYNNLYNMTGDDSYEVAIESVEYDWSNAVISEAEEQLAEGKYDVAIELLKEPKRSISNNSAIAEEEKRINSFRPLEFDGNDYSNYLYTDIYTTYRDESMGWRYWWLDYCKFGRFSNVTDNLGKKYDAGILLRTTNGFPNGHGTGKIDYPLDGKYDTFSCTFFIAEKNKNTSSKFKLNIYGDDILIYSTETISGGDLPVEVNTNITDIYKLTLEFVYDFNGDGSSGDYIVISDMSLRKEYHPLYD